MTYDNRLMNQAMMMQTQAIPSLESGSTELIDRLFYNTQTCARAVNGVNDTLNDDPLF
jgi:hypothetical protein